MRLRLTERKFPIRRTGTAGSQPYFTWPKPGVSGLYHDLWRGPRRTLDLITNPCGNVSIDFGVRTIRFGGYDGKP